MKHKVVIGCLIFLVMGSTVFSQENEKRRGGYLDVGIGFGGISYGEEVDDLIQLVDDNGLDRFTMSLDLSVGWAVLQNLYVVGSVSGFRDRLYKSSDYMQFNTYLYGVGIKFYPLPSKKHLQLGVDLGLGKMALQLSVPGINTIASENGFAAKVSIAYDFDSTMTGPALLLGGDLLMDFIDSETITGFSVFAKFVLK
jgi:hypothetical protein